MYSNKYLRFYILIITQMLLQHHQSDAIKCYVCGDTNNFLYSTNDKAESPPVSCTTLNHHWNNSKAMEKYINECPKEYYGCITQIQGGQVTRACDIFPLDDCQIANSITYCYCSYDLCNGETDALVVSSKTDQVVDKLTSSTKRAMINYKDLLDDEDYNIEMSGYGNNDNGDENVQDKIPTSTETNIETTKIQSTTKNNVPQISTDEIIPNTINNTKNEVNNDILIEEDQILTTTIKYKINITSTSIKNNIKNYNKNNLNNSNPISNMFNKHLLIIFTILHQQIIN